MNSTHTAHSLLSLPPDVSEPNPYMVLGLSPGEADPAKIAATVKAVVVRLNDAKASADPAAWNQAATWVKEARRLLSDPQAKAGLDQQVAPKAPAAPPAPVLAKPIAPAFDPLAGLLPGQAATMPAPPSPPAAPAFRAGRTTTPGFAAAPAPGPPLALPPAPTAASSFGSAAPASYAPQGDATAVAPMPSVGRPASPGRRRKSRFPWTGIFLFFLTVGCIGGIAGLLFYLQQNPGGITISLQPVADGTSRDGVVVSQPQAVDRQRPPKDSVMGRLVPASDRATTTAADDWLADLPAGNTATAPAPPMVSEIPAQPSPSNADPAMVPNPSSDSPENPTPPPSGVPTVTPGPDATPVPDATPGPEATPATTATPNMATIPGVVDPTPEQLEKAELAMGKARQAIGRANWAEMTPAAEAAVAAAATAEQHTIALKLVHLAELASYYHGGVEKGLDGLGAGESFDVTEQLQIVVVEINPQKVVVRFSGRNKDFPRGELPLVIAHRVARFALPTESPVTAAGVHVYSAIAPITTPQYRAQAIKSLTAMPELPDEVSPADLVAAIQFVFGE